MAKVKKSKKFKFPRGPFLIYDQFGNAIHHHDTIYHKEGRKGFVDHVWEDKYKEIYFYMDTGETWNFENVSALPFQS